MQSCQAIVIKKNPYRESDFIISLLTDKLGKISVIARNARKSKKRFGGRLEPYLHLSVNIQLKEDKFNILEDVTLLKHYSNIMENLELFAFSSFALEHIDFLSVENVESKELFKCSIDLFENLNSGNALLPSVLRFQLKLLEINGLLPDFKKYQSGEVKFDITNGSLYPPSEIKGNKRYLPFHTDIVINPDLMDIYLGKVNTNIKVLTHYIEGHTGKKFKTSKFLEDINL